MWGGLLAGALEGASRAAYSNADEQIKADLVAKQRDADRDNQRKTHREDLILAMDLKVQESERLAARDAKTVIEADARTESKLQDKGFQKFKKDTAGADLSEEELKDFYKNYRHDQGDGYYDVKGSERAKTRLDELMAGGASPGLLSTANADVRNEVSTEKEQARMARLEKRDAAKDEDTKVQRDMERQRTEDGTRKTDAMIAKMARGPAEKTHTTAELKAMTSLDIERGIKSATGRIAMELGVEEKAVPATLKRLASSKDPVKVEQYQAILPIVENYKSLTARQMDLDRNKPKDETSASPGDQKGGQSTPKAAPSKPVVKALPPGAKQVGTSGGKPVYEVNGKRFIQE